MASPLSAELAGGGSAVLGADVAQRAAWLPASLRPKPLPRFPSKSDPRYDPAAIATTAERRNADRADLVDSRDHADIRLDVALAAHAWLGAGDVAGLLDRTLGHRAS